MTAVLVMVVVVIITPLLLFSSLKVHLRLSRRGEDDRITLTVAWLKYVRYCFDVPFVDLLAWPVQPGIKLKTASGYPEQVSENQPPKSKVLYLDQLLAAHRKYGRYTFVLAYLFRRTKIRRFRWHSEIGTGNAYQTGLATGMAWTLKSTLVQGLFAYTVPLAKPELVVFPNYQQHRLYTLLDCLIEIRLGHLLMAGLKAVKGKLGAKYAEVT